MSTCRNYLLAKHQRRSIDSCGLALKDTRLHCPLCFLAMALLITCRGSQVQRMSVGIQLPVSQQAPRLLLLADSQSVDYNILSEACHLNFGTKR
jgi:hypothetical protein